jgi:hypothetical protein
MRAQAQKTRFAKKDRVYQPIDRPVGRTRRNTRHLDEIDELCDGFDDMLFGEEGDYNNDT